MKKHEDYIYLFFLNEGKITLNSKSNINENIISEIFEQINDEFFLNKNFFPLRKTPLRLINKASFIHEKQQRGNSKNKALTFINTEKLSQFFKTDPNISILLKNEKIKILKDTFSIKKYEKRYLTYRSSNKSKEEFIFFNKDIKIFILPKINIDRFNLRIKVEKDSIKNILIYNEKKLIAASTNPKSISLRNISLTGYLIKVEDTDILIKFIRE